MATGLLRPDAGTRPGARRTTSGPTPSRAKPRIGILPDGLRLFDRLTGQQLVTYAGLLRGMDRGGRRRAHRGAARGARADRRRRQARRRLLRRHDEEGDPGLRARPRPAAAGAGRAVRGGRPGLGRHDPPASSPATSRSGGTVILSSHVMDLVERICDHVAIIAAGARPRRRHRRRGPRGRDPRGAVRRPRRRRHRRGGPGVVAHLVRLKLTLLRNGLRRSVPQLVGMVLAALYALGRGRPRRRRPGGPPAHPPTSALARSVVVVARQCADAGLARRAGAARSGSTRPSTRRASRRSRCPGGSCWRACSPPRWSAYPGWS